MNWPRARVACLNVVERCNAAAEQQVDEQDGRLCSCLATWVMQPGLTLSSLPETLIMAYAGKCYARLAIPCHDMYVS